LAVSFRASVLALSIMAFGFLAGDGWRENVIKTGEDVG
jgi:hypothetical protein